MQLSVVKKLIVLNLSEFRSKKRKKYMFMSVKIVPVKIINRTLPHKAKQSITLMIKIEEQSKEDITNLIEKVYKKMKKSEKLLSVLTLLRIIFYLEKEDKTFAIFDYTIDKGLTDQFLSG